MASLDAPTALSYRQTGKAPAKGTLMRGKLTGQAQSGKNFSTIPSKFETTLFTGNKERNGFGTRAFRFVETEVSCPPAPPHRLGTGTER